MNKNEKNYCVSCRQETNHEILFNTAQGSKEEDDFHWSTKYQVIQCKGCSSIQFRKIDSDESMITYDEDGDEFSYDETICYPPYLIDHKLLSNYYYIPTQIRTVYLETIEAFKSKSYLLAGAGFRAIIEAICIEEKIKGGNLDQKIANLLKNKLITEKESNRLHSIRFLGNDSVHEMLVPTQKKLYIVLGIIEHLLKNLYLIDKEAKSELDTIVNNYDDFLELLWFEGRKLSIGDEKSIKEILGKQTRRIETVNLQNFTQLLITDITATSPSLKWLSVGQLKPVGNDPINVQHFIRV